MAHRITFLLDAFNDRVSRDLSHEHLKTLLDALVRIDVSYLQNHPNTPLLYEAGIRYQEEPPGAEDWVDIPTILKLGFGDCEELAAWRVAELIVKFGVKARPAFTYAQKPDGSYLYHIVVWRPDRPPEDPSRELGMR